MKTILIGGIVILLLIGGAWWTKSLQKSDPDVVSRNGLHWHPTLAIYVKGEKQDIPKGIGLGATHLPMHTHDDLPIIHLEFGSVVRKEDLMLGQFFKNWGKDMHSFGTNVHMTVNGETNTEFENYSMHDKDVIELHYD
ncbi:MAG: hypothetical protein G01um10148_1027 [Parcubacteria group bacterium Gr01-1014_8]|nr:MAG: hypothetical protein G01um10148_1027 [Parcubacteria group bacterium Gr01-1014_8]